MTMRSLPELFVSRVLRELGEEEGSALCKALEAPAPVSVRLNPAKAGGEPLAALWMCGIVRKPVESIGTETGSMSVLQTANAGGNSSALWFATGAMPATGGEGGAGCGNGTVSLAETNRCGEARGTIRHASDELLPAKEVPLPVAWRIPWSEAGYYLPERPQFTLDPDFHAGAYYVQEAGSQFVGHLLAGTELAGRRVLDMCAAPGGKTTLYASRVGPEGLVVANEIDRRRAQVLTDNVRKWGLGNVAVTVAEPRQLGAFESWFDVVAVDAPCSGEGMFRKDEGARAEWSEGNVRLCAARQSAILRDAWRCLRPGGILIYSTCTFNRTENEEVLEAFAAELDGAVAEAPPVPVDPAWGIVCGRVGAFRTFRFYPHRAQGEGFFAAIACKTSTAGGRERTPKPRRSVLVPVMRAETAELARWVKHPEQMCFFRAGDTCYAYPQAQAGAVRMLADALPVIYSGVEMGQIFHGTLRPAHALALYAQLDREVLPTAEVAAEEALAYLRRQEMAASRLTGGMNLVVCRGRALGFAKRIGNRVNNLYPNTWKILKN